MSRQPYEPPSVQAHLQDRVVNQPGRGREFYADIDGVPVEALVEAWGSPLIVFSERTLRRKARTMREAFTRRYPRVRFGWSYKTNYLDAICGLMHQEGWDAEVVSELEYRMARRLGIPGGRIVCNGASKPRRWLELAVSEGAFIQIDHFDELLLLEAIAGERELEVPVGIRVNLRAASLGVNWERFGFNFENDEALDAALRVCQSRWLRLVGVHCHLGTFIPSVEPYRESARKLAQLIAAAQTRGGAAIEIINLGGGFPSDNVLAIPLSTTGEPPDIQEFAKGICEELWKAFRDRRELPELILESGRALVDDAGTLITTVLGTRRLTSGARGLVVDAGLNVLYTAHWFRHRVELAQDVPGAEEDSILHGPLCMNIDALAGPIPLPPVGPGHRLLMRSVGAYNVTQWMQFSQLRPAVVMVDEDRGVHLLRRAETLEDVKAPEALPSRFAPPE